MSGGRTVALRLGAAAAGILVAALLAEGAVSLLLGRSLLRGSRGAPTPFRMRMLDEERLAAAALTPGPYAVDVDPYVAMRLKGNHAATYADRVANTDRSGMRKPVPRPGAPEDGRRIVILGDSVAFGFGLEDHETFAERLEDFLAPITAAGRSPPVGLTVACPGWSFLNAKRFLLDHLGDLRPDVVLYLPTDNELDDSYTVLEAGHRSPDLDPGRGPDRPACSLTYHVSLLAFRRQLFPAFTDPENFYALYSGVTPESRRRYDAFVRDLTDLESRLLGARCRFAVAALSKGLLVQRTTQLLSARGVELPFVPIFDAIKSGDMLDGDPHPNARCVKAGAWRMAKRLIDDRWVETAGTLPPEDPAYAGRTFAISDRARLAAESAYLDELATSMTMPRVDMTDGTGWRQIYSGVWPDGMIGLPGFLALRTQGASAIRVKIARLPDRPGLLPLQVEVLANDVRIGVLEAAPIAAGEDPVLSASFAIPDSLRGSRFLDIRLVPSNWVTEVVLGVTRLAACKIVSVAAE